MQLQLQQHYDALRQAEADSKYWLEQYEKQLKAEYEAKGKEIETEYAKRVEEMQNTFAADTTKVRQRVETALSRLKYAAAPWTIDAWLGFPEEQPANPMKDSLRIGVIRREFPASGLSEVPLLLPLVGEGHILVISSGGAKTQARSLLQSIVLRALAMLTDGNTEFILVDPFGMGSNLPFQSLPTSIRGEMIYAEEDEITAQLRRLTDHIRSGETKKRFVLCVADFPRRFSEDALQRVISIAQQGIKANIYAIVHVDSDVSLPAGYDPAPLMQNASVVAVRGERVRATVEGTEYDFIPDSPPEKHLLGALLKKIGK